MSESIETVTIDATKCTGSGVCESIDPTHFVFDASGQATFHTNGDLDPTLIAEAVANCPQSAITFGAQA